MYENNIPVEERPTALQRVEQKLKKAILKWQVPLIRRSDRQYIGGSVIYFDDNDGKLNTVDDPTNAVRSGGIQSKKLIFE